LHSILLRWREVDYTCRRFTRSVLHHPHFLHDPAEPDRGAGEDPVHRL